jgi:hypothetical protein
VFSLSLGTFCQRSLFGFMPWNLVFQNWWPVRLGSFEGF